MSKSEDGEESYKMFSSEREVDVALLRSRQLWLPAEDPYRITSLNSSTTERGAVQALPLTEKLWAVGGSWGKNQFFGAVTTGRIPMLL